MPNAGSPSFLLLVEGQDDQHFVKQIWDKHHDGSSKPLFFKGSKRPFSILDKAGGDQLIAAIPAEITEPDRKVLGILVDANGDPMQRWKKITCELRKESEYLQLKPNKIPDHPERTGTIINCAIGVGKRELRIGVWLMPDNKSPGELEDFAAKMVPDNDPVWPSSKGYIANIPKQHRKFNCDKMPKAELFAWLATRNEPGRMGAAIGASDLALDNEPSETFLKWLSDLFK